MVSVAGKSGVEASATVTSLVHKTVSPISTFSVGSAVPSGSGSAVPDEEEGKGGGGGGGGGNSDGVKYGAGVGVPVGIAVVGGFTYLMFVVRRRRLQRRGRSSGAGTERDYGHVQGQSPRVQGDQGGGFGKGLRRVETGASTDEMSEMGTTVHGNHHELYA